MVTRSASIALLVATVTAGAACSSDAPAPSAPEILVEFAGASPGDIVGVDADDARRVVSWARRLDGTIHELSIDDAAAEPAVVGAVDVSTESLQGGLLDQAVLPDGTRIVAYTDRSNHLVVAALPAGGEPEVRWDAGAAGNGAIGGTIDLAPDGSLLVTIGRNTAWGEQTGVDGAVLRFDPDSSTEPEIVSVGYTNPWAVTAVTAPDGSGATEEIWVWDNAAGADPDDPDGAADDVERLGRADLGDRSSLERSTVADRAPTAMVELADGRLGVCGFLDNELRAYEVVDGRAGERTHLERAGTIMPCLTGAAVFSDGTVVTAARTPDGETLQILRP